MAKGLAIAQRARALRRFVQARSPDVAFSHGSYAQLAASRLAGVAAVTMMDYEHQPANHLSFRLARRVIVPEAFPDSALRRFGARRKALRYPGFKEDLYLSGFEPDPAVLAQLDLDAERIIAVFRPPPEGALYHRTANRRFDELVGFAAGRHDVEAVVLPRNQQQTHRYGAILGVRVLATPIDGSSLLAVADLTIGGGGTMNRESAVLGTPTYTVFAGNLAAVDAELIRMGLLHDLRDPRVEPCFVKKAPRAPRAGDSQAILEVIVSTLEASST
jgi:predicted glycosyltransferase